jgi:hypothetical protein
MLFAQLLLFLRISELSIGPVRRVGRGLLADAAPADEDLGLQQALAFAGFALHVVNRIYVLDVGIEAKNHENFVI